MHEVLAMTDPKETATVLKRELPIRFANRIAQMDTLPYIDKIESLQCARARLMRSFREVRHATEHPEDLAEVITKVKARHRFQVQRLTTGMQELKRMKMAAGEPEDEVTKYIDGFLNAFFLSRIGIEMLNSQYLATIAEPRGIVDSKCDPSAIARQAASAARRLAGAQYQALPPVEVSFHGDEIHRTLPLIGSYLFYILAELLKNSFHAVCENHVAKGEGAPKPDPILIRVSSDEDQVAVDIFDRGGGIPFKHQPFIWSYAYSTRSLGEAGVKKVDPTPLAGYGVGLPLSRLYAEYIGGSLHLMSLPAFGTHAFLLLQRCSQRKEGMPTYVDWLRESRLRGKLLDLEARKQEAAAKEDFAEALRLKVLVKEAQTELALLSRYGVS